MPIGEEDNCDEGVGTLKLATVCLLVLQCGIFMAVSSLFSLSTSANGNPRLLAEFITARPGVQQNDPVEGSPNLILVDPAAEALLVTWILLLFITLLIIYDTNKWIMMVRAEGSSVEGLYDVGAAIHYKVVMGRVCNHCGAGAFPEDGPVCWNCRTVLEEGRPNSSVARKPARSTTN